MTNSFFANRRMFTLHSPLLAIHDDANRLRLLPKLSLLCLTICLAFTSGAASSSNTQSTTPPSAAPRRVQLLNNLNVLLRHRANDPAVLLNLRVHSGAAFDLAGKDGLMALLGEALFPDKITRDYVTSELGGTLSVTTDHDAINITLTGRAADFERLVELLRNAVVNNNFPIEAIESLRSARLETVRNRQLDAAAKADALVANRLFNVYPYGRSIDGTVDTLAKVTRNDVLLARERFLNPNNATLVVIGGVDDARALRVLRQFLGQWRKSEAIVPATFRQPEPPDARTLIVDSSSDDNSTGKVEVRLAARGLSRTDIDYPAVMLLAIIARERWQKALPTTATIAVRHEAYAVSGIFRMSATVVPPTEAAKTVDAARSVLQTLVSEPPSPVELDRAKNELSRFFEIAPGDPGMLADRWLDAQSYKISFVDEGRALSGVTSRDVQRVARTLFRDKPIASVALGEAKQLRSVFSPTNVEELPARAADAKKPILP